MAGALTRWDPFSELASMRTAMDRLFDQGFGRLPFRSSEELGPSTLLIDVFDTNDELVVKAVIPGVDPKDVDISVEDDILTIKGETEEQEEVKEGNYLRRELRYGSFQRALRLPPTVDAAKASAAFEHGVLRLAFPKKEEARARSIKITPQGVIDAPSQN
ncbi:MAG: Hsp20/alpha crystallin family protein [Chloroflexi bacterium]|nr:Hsp20/alpha crystallin family protein [Chloroflexota bacterium]